MQEILLIKVGEVVLKGLNRSSFETVLVKNIRRRLSSIGRFEISRAQSTIYIQPVTPDADLDEAAQAVSHVFGIAAFSRAAVTEKDLEKICEIAPEYLRGVLEGARTFKVEAKRSDKRFAYISPQICAEVGGRLLSAFPHLTVDVHHPEVTVMVEVRDFGAYVHAGTTPGAGGMPVGTGGRAAVMISGGIDSPVAAYMMAKRGIELTAIHFASPPYTSERAEQKVVELLEEVAEYAGQMQMLVVPFTEIQEQIREKCPEELFTIIMRRLMMRIAQRLAFREDCQALITGESVGQVASQTMGALVCTDAVAEMPVFRPLIGMDKEEIIAISRRIGTFETSIQPYEDCCTVFTPRHPRTRPRLTAVEEAEQALDVDALTQTAFENTKARMIYAR